MDSMSQQRVAHQHLSQQNTPQQNNPPPDHPFQIGPYQIVQEVGRGEIAIVYHATDMLYGRPVALKVLPTYFAHNLAFARYFVAEGRAAMRLQHPNLVAIFDASHADGFNYVAQEWMSAGSLADVMQNPAGLPFETVVAIVNQLAAGLDYAHQQGYVHRNLHPNNILFGEPQPSQGNLPFTAKISDFYAETPPRGLLPNTYRAGSLAFLSPEQARGDEAIDKHTDIYTLGVLTYLMLTGRLPFTAEMPFVLLRQITEEPPSSLTTLQPALPPYVAQAVQQVLAKDAKMRPTSATAFARLLTHQPPPIVVSEAVSTPVSNPTTSRQPANELGTASSFPTAAPLIRKHADALPHRLGHRLFSMIIGAGLTTLLALSLVLLLQGYSFGWPTLFDQQDDRRERATQAILARQQTPILASLPSTIFMISPPFASATVLPTASSTLPVVSQTLLQVETLTPTAVDTPSPSSTLSPTSFPTETANATETATATAIASATSIPSLTPTLANNAEAVTNSLPTSPSSPSLPPPSPPPLASLPPLAGRIAYSVWNPRTGHYDVRIYRLADSVSWPILANKRQPDFSVQGNLVANSESEGVDYVVRMGTNGEEPTQISAFAQDSRPHWSPDGKAIVFDSDLVGDGRRRIFWLDGTRFGEAVSPLRYDAWELLGRNPIFLADGRVAYNGCNVWVNGSVCGLYLTDTASSQPINLTDWPGDTPTDNFGSQILMMSNRTGNWEVYLVNPASKSVQRLTQSTRQSGLATASPDLNFIAFASDRDGRWAIYVMHSDGSETHKLFDLEENYASGQNDWSEERLSWGP